MFPSPAPGDELPRPLVAEPGKGSSLSSIEVFGLRRFPGSAANAQCPICVGCRRLSAVPGRGERAVRTGRKEKPCRCSSAKAVTRRGCVTRLSSAPTESSRSYCPEAAALQIRTRSSRSNAAKRVVDCPFILVILLRSVVSSLLGFLRAARRSGHPFASRWRIVLFGRSRDRGYAGVAVVDPRHRRS